jgi:hypothetical protein
MISKTIQLGGKPVAVRESRRPMRKHNGYCDAKSIVISKGMSDRDTLLTFLHEALHKQFWFLDEDVVAEASTELREAIEDLELALKLHIKSIRTCMSSWTFPA